ncbi:hypothetical protein M9H77_24705 [Catharanthus roseus]|uniref:Uncharacterized protein n=1 Tax=Catharanthus roseus TaxID=4058 RepID=A0ACC0A630_CATRO|nr:hypothetical protein M9H77_24705 [Catharanthus roseus]
MAQVINVLEHCRLPPSTSSSASTAEFTLPLTFYDVVWINFYPIQRLLFYKLPYPKSHFTGTIIPKLKQSLSIALKHFLPLAGNLIIPLDSGFPQLRYAKGDTLSVTFAESFEDFQDLVGNHPRNCSRFYSLIPQLRPESIESGGARVSAVLAVQVTLFPNYGITIGSVHQHVIGDANVVTGFMRTWASINKFDGETELFDNNDNKSFLPFYGREVLEDPYKLTTLIFNEMEKPNPRQESESNVSKVPTKNFNFNLRVTYVMSQVEIQMLKKYAMENMPNLVNPSSFVLTCAYIWTSWLKSMEAIGEEIKVDENEIEYFLFAADYRARLSPPLPANYFGNCIVPCIAKSTRGELCGPRGLSIAAENIGIAIRERLNDQEKILKGVWFYELREINWKRLLSVSGSTKHDTYDADFGWGKPEKYECVSIDASQAVSINKSGKYEVGFEIGLSLPKNQMDTFADIFASGLKNL